MIKRFFGIMAFGSLLHPSFGQMVSGPMIGQVEYRDAKIWLEVDSTAKRVEIQYFKRGSTIKNKVTYTGSLGNYFNPVIITVGNLEPNSTYEFAIVINGKAQKQKGSITTRELWQYRKPPPDFTFLAGSCSYFNEPEYDRPGQSYGGDSSIFETMAKEKAAFMLWLGDNWYTRDVDYLSEWGLWNRAHSDRKRPVLQNFLKAMPHFATWDDHDFGPNNIGTNYMLKEKSREVFKNYWANPSYGEDGKGIYTAFNYSDVDFFLCDSRWWRTMEPSQDSLVALKQETEFLGRQQMKWLQNSLLYTRASFKIVVMGSQVLNPASLYESMSKFKNEYNTLLTFLKDHNVKGVIFMSGDRHFSEIIKLPRQNNYPLYDLTISPLTSYPRKFDGSDSVNSYRVTGIPGKHNYGRVTVTGVSLQRRLTVEYIGTKGEKLGEWSVLQSDLK